MVRQAEAEDTHLKYISDICNDFKCAVGLLLGQVSCFDVLILIFLLCVFVQLSSQKYQVIHFAKTPPYQSEEDKKTEGSIKNLTRIQDINENWVADHAKESTKMLPGGAYVLGLFVVSDEDIFSPFSSKVKSLLNTVNKTLSSREYLSGNVDNEKLVFHYLPKTQKYSAKTYDVVTSNVQPADFKFVQRATKFIHFDCVYLIDEAYYLKEKDTVGQLRKHIKVILDRIKNKLETGVILFDNELKDLDEKLENLGKKKKRGSSSKGDSTESNKPISVTIFEKCVLPPSSEQIECQSVGGEIRIVGEVISKLWLNSKETFGEAVNAVKEDIMRSLSTRMEMHWDSLTEEELGEGKICVLLISVLY